MPRAPLLALALLAAPLAAAPIPKGPKAPDDPITEATARLLKFRKVQKEINMTAEQRVTLIDALEDTEEDYGERLDKLFALPDLPGEAIDKLYAERAKAVENVLTGTAGKSLTVPQRARLRQVGWRVAGPAAFADPGLQKYLRLTPAQKKKAAALAERCETQAERYWDAYGEDTEDEVKAQITDSRKAEVKKFVDALTADQRDLWKVFAGEPVRGFDPDQFWFRVVEDEYLEILP